ncbi:RHD1 Beta-mannosyltransferase 2 [Candida maltosa Xu316]
MPVYLNDKQQKGRFYGVEDPRILLVKNINGYDEPVIIYNSHHRKISKTEFASDNEGKVNFGSYRSIFMAWLWQEQQGLSNLEELPHHASKNKKYIRIKELVKPDGKRSAKEKNWAPFINFKSRKEDGYDSHLYFMYQFENLKILKCSLLDEEDCVWEYQANDKSGAGKLRGGTELVNINQLLSTLKHKDTDTFLDMIPQGREIWIGFARAVLVGCGCGSKMYRPNVVILIKDDDKYRISHVSSFASLGIKILPWTEGEGLCEGKNLIIPNGISSWTLDKDAADMVQDFLTISISRADTTVELVHIRGFLRALLFENYNSRLLESSTMGYDNKNIECALKKSDEFCKAYAEEIKASEEKEQP